MSRRLLEQNVCRSTQCTCPACRAQVRDCFPLQEHCELLQPLPSLSHGPCNAWHTCLLVPAHVNSGHRRASNHGKPVLPQVPTLCNGQERTRTHICLRPGLAHSFLKMPAVELAWRRGQHPEVGTGVGSPKRQQHLGTMQRAGLGGHRSGWQPHTQVRGVGLGIPGSGWQL